MKIEEFKEEMKKKYHDGIDVEIKRNENGVPVLISVWDPEKDQDYPLEEFFLEEEKDV